MPEIQGESMEKESVKLRMAKTDDARALLDIYAYYIKKQYFCKQWR
mgnify:CR=1 FL=1